jgi:hypothetical protein
MNLSKVPPAAVCPRVEFGELLADPRLLPWKSLDALELSLNATGGVPKQATHVRLGRDSHALRILFVAEDTNPWATFTERDAPLYQEEVVEVFLDPEGDGMSYFEIEVNPKNAVLDGCMRLIRSGFKKDFRWQCEGLLTLVSVFDGGWAAEMEIPFLSVADHIPGRGETWRVNFTRIDRPDGEPRELSAWAPTGYDQFHMPGKFGEIVFE